MDDGTVGFAFVYFLAIATVRLRNGGGSRCRALERAVEACQWVLGPGCWARGQGAAGIGSP